MNLYTELADAVTRTKYEYYKENNKDPYVIIAMDMQTYDELMHCEEIYRYADMRAASDEFFGCPICITRNREFGFKVAVTMDRG